MEWLTMALVFVALGLLAGIYSNLQNMSERLDEVQQELRWQNGRLDE